jgi:hypothetical protein
LWQKCLCEERGESFSSTYRRMRKEVHRNYRTTEINQKAWRINCVGRFRDGTLVIQSGW